MKDKSDNELRIDFISLSTSINLLNEKPDLTPEQQDNKEELERLLKQTKEEMHKRLNNRKN
jgi:hypothetical protein